MLQGGVVGWCCGLLQIRYIEENNKNSVNCIAL
ncbi:hypothetical protein LMED105_01002 [Limnobacter sp. MED105]|nr:hypothetical protein LMED105_01002 [Limnobacter sp. MED105]